MKKIISRIIACMLGILLSCSLSWGQTDLGSYGNSFTIQESVLPGSTLSLTLTQPMTLNIHNYQTPDLMSSGSGYTSVTVTEAATGTVIGAQTGSLNRNYVYDTDKACLYLPDLPAGTYEIEVNGEYSNIPVTIEGYASSGAYSHAGEDMSLAIDLGPHGTDFSYSHLRNTDHPNYWSSYGYPSKEVYYRFILTESMYVVINHWGSPVAAESQNVPTTIYILQSTTDGIEETARTWQFDSPGSIMQTGDLDYLEAAYDLLPETERFSSSAAAWHGWLEPGSYYVISESPYYGGNMAHAVEGLLLTNIRAFAFPFIDGRKNIDAGGSAGGEMYFVDSKFFSSERKDDITYVFSIDASVKLTIDTDAESIILKKGNEIINPSSYRNGTREYEFIQPGSYSLRLSSNRTGLISTSIRSEYTPLPDKEPSIGDLYGNFSFNGRMTLPEQSDTTLNFKFRIKETCAVIFDYTGSQSEGFVMSLRDSLDALPFLVRPMEEDDALKFHLRLAPGTYYHEITTESLDSKILMGLRTMEDIADADAGFVADKRKNHIITYAPKNAGTNSADSGNSRTSVEYFDDMGRPLQTVRTSLSPFGSDLANFTGYEHGRPVMQWLDIADGSTGSFKTRDSFVSGSGLFYGGDDEGYSTTVYESSPVGRVESEYGPGKDWHQSGRNVSFGYMTNSSSGAMLCRKFTVSGAYDEILLPTCSGSYASGELSVVRTVSEDGVSAYEFTDRKGRLILTRTVKGDEYIDTYFVYDIRNQLRAVITPAASEAVNIDGSLTSSTFDKYCYGYGYDDRGNQVTSKNPGSAPSRTIFNALGHPLFRQTPRQALSGEWSFDIPDIHGRSAIKGIVTIEESILHEMAEADIYAEFYPGDIVSGLYAVCNYPFLFDELRQVFFYDDYTFLNECQSRGEALAYKSSYGPDSRREDEGLTCRGMMTGSLTRDLETGDMRLSAIYYDRYGNITQTVFENNAGGVSVITNTHDFLGNVLTEKESHSLAGGTESLLSRIHEYDRAGRLVQTVTDLDGVEVVTRNTYDPVGRLEMTVVTSGEVSDTTLRSYNVRGWQTEIQNDSWSSVMRYQNPEFEESDASFTGNISEWEWTRGNSTDTYSLEYDALSRIVDSRLFRNGNPVDALSESGISYDSNGNILALKRTGEDGSIVNDLVYSYDGNRLASFSDGDFQSQNYTYDADGNMTFDGRAGMALIWNDLGFVEKVCKNDTVLVNYSYLADGTKVSALDNEGNGLLYLGSLIYKKTGDSIELESAGFAGGRFVARETSPGVCAMVPIIHVTDHLGSVRAVVDGVSGAVVETNDYYPFGSRWDVATSLKDDSNRFRYNSKEEQSSLYPASIRNAVSYIDYGARQYDPVLGRWFAQDPLSEKYYSISPYAFCANNPVKYLDPDGQAIGKAFKVAKKTYKALKAGNKLSVKSILKSEVLDIVDNANTLLDPDASLFEKGIAAFDLATGFGDEAKWLAKTVGVSDAIVDGARVVDGIKFKSFTERNFRDNLMRLTGETPDAGKQAHHTLPQKFRKEFSKIGINIHDPKYGVWLDSKQHNKLSQKYNKAWEQFFKANTSYTVDQVMEHAKKLMNEIYGQ